MTKPLLHNLATKRFLSELHHFLWDPPHLNRGVRDFGWNCRDHAWCGALLARAAGFGQTVIHHGKAHFWGKRKASHPRIGLSMAPHSWVGVPCHGLIDLSVKSKASFEEQDFDLGLGALFLDRFVSSPKARFVSLRDYSDLSRVVGLCSERGESSGIYALGPTADALAPEIVTGAASYIGSPLTDWIKARHDPDRAYASLLLHLIAMAAGEAQTHTHLTREHAWQIVLEKYSDPIDQAIVATGLNL